MAQNGIGGLVTFAILMLFLAFWYARESIIENTKNSGEAAAAAEDDRKDAKIETSKQKQKKKSSSTNPFALEIPRVTLEELQSNKTLMIGHHPFVLTGMIRQQWNASNWTLQILRKKIPFEWVDYYRDGMHKHGLHPILIKLEEAIPMFKVKDPRGVARYLQMRISIRGWKRLRKDLQPLPEHFWSDDSWIRHCMKKEDGKPDEDAIDNFYTTNQWKFLLIGEKGTSMFFHKDGTAASSWQAMIVGRKKWTLCPNTETKYLTETINTFNPDYKAHPQFARAHCGQVTIHPGEMVYYPAYWWHHTYQLDTPSIAYTGALVGTELEYSSTHHLQGHRKAHLAFYKDLMNKCGKCWTKGKKERHCDDISLKWPGAAPPPMRRVCDKFLPECYKLWDEHAKTLLDPVGVSLLYRPQRDPHLNRSQHASQRDATYVL